MKNAKRFGFTLVELAIVLVIVGLLVGGIIQGQELIEQARITNVVAQTREYNTAISTFIAKYRAIPGDARNASVYGLNCPADATCSASADNVADTDWDSDADGSDGDGDGDGYIESCYNSLYTLYCGELANGLVHLSNALFIRGGLTQTDDCMDADCPYVRGVNIADTAIGVGMVLVTNRSKLSFIIGTGVESWSEFNYDERSTALAGDALTPDVAFRIDEKIDDGKPDKGVMVVISSYSYDGDKDYVDIDTPAADDCILSADTYNINLTVPTCTLIIRSN